MLPASLISKAVVALAITHQVEKERFGQMKNWLPCNLLNFIASHTKTLTMRITIIAVFAVLAFSSCHYMMGERIRGNGHITSRDERVGSFTSVDVGGAISVSIKQDQNHSVKIETDENLMEFIEVFTEGNTLVIRPRRGYNLDPSRQVIAYVSAPVYKRIEVSGASKIIGENSISGSDELRLGASGASEIELEVDGGELVGDVSGASRLRLRGQVSLVDIHGSGASHVKAFDLVADEAIFDFSGASSADITANKSLRVDASGASHVRYRGNASVNSHTSGASSISKQ